MPQRRFFLIAGEVSGDQIGADLIKSLRKKEPSACFYGIGGDLMKAEGQQQLFHSQHIAVMGIVDVIRHYKRLRGLIDKTIDHLRQHDHCAKYTGKGGNAHDHKYDSESNDDPHPHHFDHDYAYDAVICIDAQEFCKKVVSSLRHSAIKKILYVAPQVWAWRPWRAKAIARLYDMILTLFPFEVHYFKDYNENSHYVGHPLYDQIKKFQKEQGLQQNCNQDLAQDLTQGCNQELTRDLAQNLSRNLTQDLHHDPRSEKQNFLILPGSRHSEIHHMLPLYIKSLILCRQKSPKWLKEWRFQLITTSEQFQKVTDILQDHRDDLNAVNIDIDIHDSKERFALFQHAGAAIACSGTVTLELGLFHVPMIVAYRMGKGWLSNMFMSIGFKMAMSIRYAALANLIPNYAAGHYKKHQQTIQIVPEYLLHQATIDRLSKGLHSINHIKQSQELRAITSYFHDYDHGQTASDCAADYILRLTDKKTF
jgi:lipid-A-disaccharide synthase